MSEKHINRREILRDGLYSGLAASLSPSLWLSGCTKISYRKQPNIILISIDTLRPDHMGCYGYSRPTSPVMDQFASEGLLFEDVTSPSPWTLPAHGSMLTGLYPNRHALKSRDISLPKDIITLAEVLQKQEYTTTEIINCYYLSKRYEMDRGFTNYTYVVEKPRQVEPSQVEDKAKLWLSNSQIQPFFLFLHYFDVHSDYCSQANYEKMFLRPYNGKFDGRTTQLVFHREAQIALEQADGEHLVDLYDAGIRQIDDGLDRLFSFLKSKGLYDNTYIIFTSDHGEEFLDHGSVLHGRTQFQEMIKAPLIIQGPGIPKRKRIKYTVSLVDLMPTILSMVNAPIPPSLDGIDLSPLWTEKNASMQNRYIFAGADKNNKVYDIKQAVRHPRYKLHYDKLNKSKQLYDLQLDPGEKTDISSEYSELVNSMMAQLNNYMSITNIGRQLDPLSEKQIQKLKSLGYL
jgi:arylsulfatase A-like enzyme